MDGGFGFIGGVGVGNYMQNSGMDKIDRAILECYMNDPTINKKSIATIVGLHYTNVYKRISRPVMVDAITEINGSLDQILAQGKRLAAKRMKRLIMSGDDSIALRASTELLKAELSGESSVQQPIRFITVVNEVGVLETQSIDALEADLIPPVTKPTD